MSVFNTLEIYPTNQCQLACTECSLHRGNESWNELMLESVIRSKIFSKISSEIVILGGEPTMWPYLEDLIAAIRSQNHRCAITITSNGLSISKELIETCKAYNAKISISWHGYDSIIETAVKLNQKKLLKNIIFTPATSDVFSKYESLKLLFGDKCVFRPLVGSSNIKNFVSFNNKRLSEYCGKNQVRTQSFERSINGISKSNLELIKSLDYSKHKCKCGNNAVLYTDGNLYHSLSQAIAHKDPLNMYSVERKNPWIDCKYEFCCCDTFDLRTK